MGSGSTAGDHRWQGYSHEELYQMLHAGPGSSAAGVTAGRWSGLSGALADIQSDIASGVISSGASWEGQAADSARDALGPLGDWAQQASTAAEMMRISTELQGSLLAKARSDMPRPVPVSAEQPNGFSTALTHLFGGQTDYEVQEAASNAAAQRAYQVMAGYEAGSTDNTNTLGDFGQPPNLVVDSAPVAAASSTGIGGGRHTRRATTRRGTDDETSRPGSAAEEAAGSAKHARSGSARPSGSSAAEPEDDPSAVPPAPEATEAPGTPPAATPGAPAEPGPPAFTPPASPSSGAPAPGAPATSAPASGAPVPSEPGASTTTSAAAPVRSGPSRSPVTFPPPPEGTAAAAGVLPPGRRREDDAEHQRRYLVQSDDLYGTGESVSPSVIGE